jgi:hypothetical protein
MSWARKLTLLPFTFFPAIAALPSFLFLCCWLSDPSLPYGAHDQPTPGPYIQIFASVGSWLLKGTHVLMLRRLMGVSLLFALLSHFASWLIDERKRQCNCDPRLLQEFLASIHWF